MQQIGFQPSCFNVDASLLPGRWATHQIAFALISNNYDLAGSNVYPSFVETRLTG